MKLKTNLNIIAGCSIGAILLTLGVMWYSKNNINNQLEKLNRLNEFEHTTSELHTVVEEYIIYGKERNIETWNNLFPKLRHQEQAINKLPKRKVIDNYLAAIRDAFNLIRDIQENPNRYPDTEQRNKLLDKAQARIRADIQMFKSIAYLATSNLQEQIQSQQKYQFVLLQILIIPAIILISILIFRVRNRIIDSLTNLLRGTQKIANGKLDTVIEVTGNDEHSKLADEFNAMANKLQRHVNQLEASKKKIDQSRQRWERLVEQDPNLILISIDGFIQFMNPAGLKLFGADDLDDMKGQHVYDYVNESQIQKAQSRIKKVQKYEQKVSPTIYEVQTLYGETRYLQLESMPIKYENQKATQTVGLDITDRILYERQLKQSLDEKTVLLKEVHHRVKNNLAVISGLMELQTMESEDKFFNNKLKASQLRIQSIASIHELLYQTESFSKLKFKKQVTKLVGFIRDTLQPDIPVNIRYNLDDVTLNVNKAIPAALIINELVSNALEHAFQDSSEGEIHIILKEKGDSIRIKISDDGKGFPGNFDINKPESLGIKLIKILTQQLDGTLEFHSGEHGTTFTLKFKNTEVKGIGSHHLN